MKLLSRLGCFAAFIGSAALLLTGCANSGLSTPPPSSPSTTQLITCKQGEPQVNTYLFFGLNRPHGAKITEKEWANFLNKEVTPRFKEGLTVYTGTGQWLGNDGKLAKETTKVLMLLHPDSPQVDQKITMISQYYQHKFAQDAVMRVDNNTCVSFITSAKK